MAMQAGHELKVSTLIVPKQKGGPDECTMTNEEELFEYCLTHSLLTLGWIHVSMFVYPS
jgi:hypothetical protein